MSGDPAAKTARFVCVSDANKGSSWRAPKRSGPLRVGWRLIAANNRALGRSWKVYGDVDACVAAAAQLHDQIGEATSSMTFDTQHGTWSWTVLVDDVPAAVSVRMYRRRVDCMRSVDQFLGGVKSAPEVAQELRYYGPNALRMYDFPPGGPLHPDVLSLPSLPVPNPVASDDAEAVAT